MDISYQETQDRLANRIRAHKLFGNFDISDWIADFLGRRSPASILDLGCGDGNHIDLYLRCVGDKGTVAGVDRDQALIERVRSRHPDTKNLALHVTSMDEKLPFDDGVFDLCMVTFAIYNATDAEFTLRELHRVTAKGGEVVMIGPTPNNVAELYEFNEKVTGRKADERTLRRTARIVQEFLPLTLGVFGRVQAEVLHSVLTFPEPAEFLRYFCSTLLYEEIAEREGYSLDDLKAYCPPTGKMTVSKEMVAVVAAKSD
ncbi:class I SAM-dependent methyltransferase [Microbispora sp. NEAU-D428]|uniref:class I SAM-dependent methyltransferase n=1 Tax=Microbispora sitophila TaxID=2771537 RepID=UPI001866C5E0|nr:class I SAM-dependent methyltransferase [Microbispora sitophila]MBE3011309.1 class I SAM-dependent methyltransferase [Microbispora sitophila]